MESLYHGQVKRTKATKERAVRIRVSDPMYEQWLEAAQASGITLSQWIRMRVCGVTIEAIPPRKVG